jgi:ATP-dependent helicase HrpB
VYDLSLPIDAFLPDVVSRLRPPTAASSATCRNLVLVAEPGAGKTTRVPPALIRADGLLPADHPAIVMLQPRRVAARAAAERIAEENNWTLGTEVGYHVRFERRLGPSTRIRVLTEAILSRQLLSDPELPGVGCVILDEFHERSIHCDLALALLREVQLSLRPDLIILVMSATLEAGPVSAFLGNAPILRVPGRTFPVTIEHTVPRGISKPLELQLADAVSTKLPEPGHILCFLPGAEEIRRGLREISRLPNLTDADTLLPLHGSLPFDEQRRAVSPLKGGGRKIILATNIAETSLTIDGVRTVIDTGLSRQIAYDPRRGLERLELGRISKASATQRAGRAGRTAPGTCVRLWSAKEHNELPDFDEPELRRIDLAPTLLTLLAWGVRDVEKFAWFEPPAPESVQAAVRLLEMLGAAQRDTDDRAGLRVTALGRRMSSLPVHPRLARLLVDAEDAGRPDEGALLAAMLSERDFRRRDTSLRHRDRGPRELADSDLTPRLELLDYIQRRNFHPSLEDDEGIDLNLARQILRTRDELKTRSGRRPATNRQSNRDLILPAYPDRVCLRRTTDPSGSTGLMVGGVGVVLDPESAVRHSPLFLALDARQDDRTAARQASISLAHAVTLEDLQATFPESLRRVSSCIYDEAKDKVVGRLQLRYHDLVLEEKDDAKVDDETAAEALAAALLPRLADRLARDDAAQNLLARLTLARTHLASPDHPWPGPDLSVYREELTRSLLGTRRLADFQPADFLRSLLPWPLPQLLDEHVPPTFTVPTGNRIRIDYTPITTGQNPVLPVRLQELFGQTTTPSICRGKIPLTLHLLSPGYKPVQITQDLVSFWKNTYAQVKKDLKARYPKHAWPEDPLSALPVAKGRAQR